MGMLCNAASGSCRRLVMKVVVATVLYIAILLCFVIFLTSCWVLVFAMLISDLTGLNNLLMAYEDKSAYALCAFSFAFGPNAEPITFLGKTPVHICGFVALDSDGAMTMDVNLFSAVSFI